MLLSLRGNAVVPLSPHAIPDGVGGSTWTAPGQDGTPRWNTAPPDPLDHPEAPRQLVRRPMPGRRGEGNGPADPPSLPQPMPGCRWRTRGIVPAVTGTLTPDPPPTRRFHRRDGTPPGRRLMTCPPASSPRFTRSPRHWCGGRCPATAAGNEVSQSRHHDGSDARKPMREGETVLIERLELVVAGLVPPTARHGPDVAEYRIRHRTNPEAPNAFHTNASRTKFFRTADRRPPRKGTPR